MHHSPLAEETHSPCRTDPIGEGASTTGPGIAPFDLVVADASWIWTERLFAPLAAEGVRVLLLKLCDWRTAARQGRKRREWSSGLVRTRPGLWEQRLVLPPGWMKSYPRLGMRPVARAIGEWRATLDEPRPLALAMSYPHYLYLRDMIGPKALIYYNMDDYALYWARWRAKSVRNLEHRAVAEADLSIVCARSRAEELRAAVPEAAGRIVHLPHGAPAHAIAGRPQDRPAAAPPDLAVLPRPYLGFVGTLEDRIDWRLLERVSREFPSASVVLIGAPPVRSGLLGSRSDCRRALAQPNVHLLGWRAQENISAYMAAFDVCMIPYWTDHPFNRACCPTKIMDYMATSRPVVTTALPECRLYEDLFGVAEDHEAFVAEIARILALGSDDGRASRRWSRARAATWEHRARTLWDLLMARTERRRHVDRPLQRC